MKSTEKNHEITDPNEILEQIIIPAKNFKMEIIKENQQVTKKQMDEIIDLIQKYYDVPKHIALIGLAATLQKGGTSRHKKSNVKIRIAQTTFESKVINSYIITATNKTFTPRQFARYFANQIFDLSKAHDIDGNCYVYLTRNMPELLTEESNERYWASDFQVDNPSCPQNIRNALNMRYNAKFRGVLNKSNPKK